MTNGTVRRFRDLATVALFLGAIALPATVGFLQDHGVAVAGENRRAAPRPPLALRRKALREYPAAFEAWYNDAFGLRAPLIRGYNHAMVGWFGVSPNPKVVIGKDGWLFLGAERTMDDYRVVQPFRPQDLEAWQHALEDRQAWLAARGIRFLVVLPPNGQTVYPEFVPDAYDRVRPTSRLDQLATHLAAHSTIELLDLRPALLAAKAHERVWHRTDSHWNDRGAFVAYQAIVDRLARWYPNMTPAPRDAFEETVEADQPGRDLAGMLDLRDVFREDVLGLRRRTPGRASSADPHVDVARDTKEPWAVPQAYEGGDPTGPRAVVLRDSFSIGLIPLLSEHFSRVLYLTTYDLRPRLIERERPDVVILQLVERHLLTCYLVNASQVAGARLRAEASQPSG